MFRRLFQRPRIVPRLTATAAVSVVLAGSLVLQSSPASALVVAPPPILVPAASAVAPASALTATGVLATGGLALAAAGLIWVGGNCITGTGWCPIPQETIDGWVTSFESWKDDILGTSEHFEAPAGGWSRATWGDGTFSGGSPSATFSADYTWAYEPGMEFTNLAGTVMNPYFHSDCYRPASSGVTAAFQVNFPVVITPAIAQASGTMTVGPLCPDTYYPLGVQIAQPDQTSAPFRHNGGYYPNPFVPQEVLDGVQVVARQTCVNPDTQATEVVTYTTQPGNLVAPSLSCPVGMVPTGVEYELQVAPGFASAPVLPVGGLSWGPTVPTEYPNCVSGDCAMWVEVDGVPLQHGNPDAPFWWAISRLTPERVQCKWGGAWGSYSMPLSDCEPLKYAWWTPTTVGTTYDPERGFVPVQDVNTDPLAEPELQPWPETDPLPDVETMPSPSPSPSVSPSVSAPPGTDPLPYPEPGPNPNPEPNPEFLECVGAEWSWNPISWVYLPVKCALIWAFVPTVPPGEILDGLKDDAADTPLGEWFVPLDDLGDAFAAAGGGSCMGPAMALGEPFNETLYPLNACDPPVSTLAMLTKAGTTALIGVTGFLASLRAIGRGFGYSIGLGQSLEQYEGVKK